jgi:hypothetical protein
MSSTIRRYLKPLVITGIILLTAAAATWIYLDFAFRRFEEYRYIVYLKEFLPEHLRKTKTWPSSLAGVEHELQDQHSKGFTRHAESLLATHRNGKPVLVVLYSDAANFRGEVKFLWLFGGSYKIQVRKE